MNEKRKKQIIGISVLAAVVIIFVVIFLISGKPIAEFFEEPEEFRLWVSEMGFMGKIVFTLIVAFQVVVAFIPGEPVEIAAGYAFGAIEGTVLCLLGILLASVLIFLLVRKLGMKFVTLFIDEEKFKSLRFLKNQKRLNLVIYLIFLIPGIPKDVMTYFVGLTPMKLSFWIFTTVTARIPSVLTSTIGGDALGTENYEFAVIVFAVVGVMSLAGIWFYNKYISKKNGETPD